MVEPRTPYQWVLGSIPTGVVLCPCAGHINSLQYWFNQERLLYPDMAEKLLTGTLSINNNISVKMGLLLCMLLFLYIFNGTIIKFNTCVVVNFTVFKFYSP